MAVRALRRSEIHAPLGSGTRLNCLKVAHKFVAVARANCTKDATIDVLADEPDGAVADQEVSTSNMKTSEPGFPIVSRLSGVHPGIHLSAGAADKFGAFDIERAGVGIDLRRTNTPMID